MLPETANLLYAMGLIAIVLILIRFIFSVFNIIFKIACYVAAFGFIGYFIYTCI